MDARSEATSVLNAMKSASEKNERDNAFSSGEEFFVRSFSPLLASLCSSLTSWLRYCSFGRKKQWEENLVKS